MSFFRTFIFVSLITNNININHIIYYYLYKFINYPTKRYRNVKGNKFMAKPKFI